MVQLELQDVRPQVLFGLDESKIFNNYTTHQKGGSYVAYNATEIDQVQQLYERMLKEKDKRIEILESLILELNG